MLVIFFSRRSSTAWVRTTWRRVQRATTSARPMWPRSVWHIATRPCAMSSTSSRRDWRLSKHSQIETHLYCDVDKFLNVFFTATVKEINQRNWPSNTLMLSPLEDETFLIIVFTVHHVHILSNCLVHYNMCIPYGENIMYENARK